MQTDSIAISITSSPSILTTTTVTKHAYDEFDVPTPMRSARVVVEDQGFYVNPGWLGELSRFFASMFYGENDEDIVLDNHIKREEFLELMRVATYCPVRKPITMSNVGVILKMAQYFEMKSIIERCEDFINRNIETLDRVRLFQVACAVAKYDRFSPTMTMLIDKLSSMKHEDLSSLHFSQVPGDVVADVFAAKMKRREMRRKRWCCFS